MFFYGLSINDDKPKINIAEEILKVLKRLGRPARGRAEFTPEVLGKEYTLEDVARFNKTLNELIEGGQVLEKKHDVWGSVEYTYEVV